ncbi:MAG: hypothetical protein IKW74_03900, partial [Thermoguttaceae bacterium]|nr:hypothetical protein [Thermoguttaceae bacterium]
MFWLLLFSGVLFVVAQHVPAYSPSGLDSPVTQTAETHGNGIDEGRIQDYFKNPPDEYGEVPFWWWTGEKLDVDRLIWQLDQLHEKGIPGVQVNYAHQDINGWPTYPNDPEIFTETWWNVFAEVAKACRERQMGIGLSGYTLDWQGCADNLWGKLIFSDPDIWSQTLTVERITLSAGQEIQLNLQTDYDKRFITAIFYPKAQDILETSMVFPVPADVPAVTAEQSKSQNVSLDFLAPIEGELWIYYAKREENTLNPLHWESGQRVIDRFFQPFENHVTGSGQPVSCQESGLNYFFQDELRLGTGNLTWYDDLPDEFETRKGYSFWTAVPAMFDVACGNQTEKYRLDYMDVRVRLAEERYFIPIFNWHNSRGMIYACDPASRGTNPAEDGDYFSIHRWYTAPGHDTPGGKADFIKNKVSSSIAHFYGRPRVWLEGYHSFGWGAAPEQLMFATNEN